MVPLDPHSKGTDCHRLGTCSRLLLGTSIIPPQDIWGLCGASTTCIVITRASSKANWVLDMGMLLPAVVHVQTAPSSWDQCWTMPGAGDAGQEGQTHLLVQLFFYGVISSTLRVSDTHPAEAELWVHV